MIFQQMPVTPPGIAVRVLMHFHALEPMAMRKALC